MIGPPYLNLKFLALLTLFNIFICIQINLVLYYLVPMAILKILLILLNNLFDCIYVLLYDLKSRIDYQK